MLHKRIKTLTSLLLASTATGNVLADHGEIEEVIVTGEKYSDVITIDSSRPIAADSGALLRTVPGANINKNGEITSIAQYRGMFGDRVNVNIDGEPISGGGPNAMDAPLSYAPTPMLDSFTVYRGIAPVSAGQETIGGSIKASTYKGEFNDSSAFDISGNLEVGGQTVNSGSTVNGLVAVSNDSHLLSANFLDQDADDSEFAEGDIIPSEYERQRYDLNYAGRSGDNGWSFSYGRNDTGESGTPALPMDIMYIDSDLYNAGFTSKLGETAMTLSAGYSDIEHAMNNFTLRTPMMGRHRETLATGENRSAKLMFETPVDQTLIRYGADLHYTEHSADISDPTNAMFFVTNFNNAERNTTGIFAEIESQLSRTVRLESGLRVNRVSMDADEVDTSMAMMMPAAMTLRDDFNNADRSQDDTNLDAVLKTIFSLNSEIDLIVGIAQKTRSASYQERYLWLPMQATGGLADGNTYIGNLELDPEVSREIELGLDANFSRWFISPRVFYKDVKDYIQGTPSTNMAANMVGNMMMGAEPLQFNNVDANIYGMDMEGAYEINNAVTLRGLFSYVRGERDDINDDLYRIAPMNLTWALDYSNEFVTATFENRLVAEQDKVSETNNEIETSGYGLLNVYAVFNLSRDVHLTFGIENLGDKNYNDHLGGVNRVMMNPDIAVGERLPGLGRNTYLKVNWDF